MKIGIIGGGNIGSEVYRQAVSNAWDVKFVMKIDGVYKNLEEKIDGLENSKKYLENLDIAFLAIPTCDDGTIASNYMKYLVEKGIPVVTCEKGALSKDFTKFEPFIEKGMIGYSATVGGGTRMLKYAEKQVGPDTKTIHANFNGTTNYCLDNIPKRRCSKKVFEETRDLGYAEPEAKTGLEIMNKESAGDVPMKGAIFFNFTIGRLIKEYVSAREFSAKRLENDDFKRLIKEASNRRYIFSIMKKGYEIKEDDIIGGFKYQMYDYFISAGFKKINSDKSYESMKVPGVYNSLAILDGKDQRTYGVYNLQGPGAGAEPTVSSMMKDGKDIISHQGKSF